MISIVSLLITKHTAQKLNSYGEAPFWRDRGAEYARKFFAGVKRHTTVPYQAFLLTDSPELAPEGVIPVPSTLPQRQSPGWWRKVEIFRDGLLPEGRVFYSDLDNVVSGPLDPLLTLEPAPLIMMHDTPNKFPGRWGQGSTMLFRTGELAFLWEEYSRNPGHINTKYTRWPLASDQAFIQTRVEQEFGRPVGLFQELLPNVKFMNSMYHLEQGGDTTNCSFVYGCYIPKPHESTHPFYKEHWRE